MRRLFAAATYHVVPHALCVPSVYSKQCGLGACVSLKGGHPEHNSWRGDRHFSGLCYNCHRWGHPSWLCPMPRGVALSHNVPGAAESGASNTRIEAVDLQKLLERNDVLNQKLREHSNPQEVQKISSLPLEEQIRVLTRKITRLSVINRLHSEIADNNRTVIALQKKIINRQQVVSSNELGLQRLVGAAEWIAVLSRAVRNRLDIPEWSSIKHLPAIRRAVKYPESSEALTLLEECGHLNAEGLKTKWAELAKRYPVIDDKDTVHVIHAINYFRNLVVHRVPEPYANITDPEELTTLLRETVDSIGRFVSTSPDPDRQKAEEEAFKEKQMTKLRAIAKAVVGDSALRSK